MRKHRKSVLKIIMLMMTIKSDFYYDQGDKHTSINVLHLKIVNVQCMFKSISV